MTNAPESNAESDADKQPADVQNASSSSEGADANSAPVKNASNSKSIEFNKDISIRLDERLKHLEKESVRAYRAIGAGRNAANLFALICDKDLTPRFTYQSKYKTIDHPNLCRLITSDKVYWPPDKKEYYCFIYEDTLGNPLVDRNARNIALGWRPESVMQNVVMPMIEILRTLRNKEMYHGEIWPGNIFDGGAKAGQKIHLGECLATPAASQLPAVFEPIERAMADPLGRGPGEIMDDLYSFGVTLAVMLRTQDPLKDLNDEQIIERKIEKSSYSTLMGKDRLSGAMLELLRGLLYDDPEQRWGIEDLEDWVDGRRLSPKQAPQRFKASRPIIFNHKKYLRPETLAKDIHLDPNELTKLIDNKEIDQWVERAIEDKIVKSRLEQAIVTGANFEKGNSYGDRLCVIVSHALFPGICIRYKDIFFNPLGFGKYLVKRYRDQQDIQAFVDVMKYYFIAPLLRESKSHERRSLVSKFDTCRNVVKQKGLNSGIEKCLYILDPEAPCLSEITKDYYVQTPTDMIRAFQSLCAKSKPAILFDRHTVSFLGVKDRYCIDPYIAELNSEKPHVRVLGQLKVLATIQKRANLEKFPALGKWFFKNLDPVFKRFHDTKKSSDLKEKIKALAIDGDLKAMAQIFDDAHIYQTDLNSFHQAIEKYKDLVAEEKKIERELAKGKVYGVRTGQQVASVIAMALSFVIILISIYAAFIKG